MSVFRLIGFLCGLAGLPMHAQTTEFGNLLVIQNDSGNTTTSVTVSKGPGSSPNFAIREGSNKADYNVTFGNANDYESGVVVAAVSENGRNNDAFGETIGTFYTTVGVALDNVTTPNRYFLALFRAPNGDEQNQNVACAFLPYSQWLGGTARNAANINGGVTDTLKASDGIQLGSQFTTAGGGLFGLNLTSINASNSSQNGVLLVSHLKNEDNYANSTANADGSFTMRVRDNGRNGTDTEQDPIAFVYLPTRDVGTKFLKAMGRVNNDASTDVAGGAFTVSKGGTGQWYLTIPGMSSATGVLIVSPEGGGTNNADNIISYQWDAANLRYVVESRDIVDTSTVPVLQNGATSGEDMFSFAFFEVPNVPEVTLTTPANGAHLVTGTAFEVEGTAVGGDASVVQVEFLRDGVVVSTDNTAPYGYTQPSLLPGGYSFTMRATDDRGYRVSSDPVRVTVTLDPGNLPANTALWFDGVNDHLTMGVAPELGVGGPPSNGMTLECWFRRDGNGVTASSGSGGVAVVPLVSRGRGETDGSNLDCNYLFGITTDGLLGADFETYPAVGLRAGDNYPITGTNAPLGFGSWHHAAVTYDGTTATWTLYLDGVAVGTRTVDAGALPRFDSIQHFGLATAMNSTGVTQGAFHGAIDEVRIWNHARTAQQIADFKDLPVVGAVGLVGRFGLNEGIGGTTISSAGERTLGALVNGPLWINGAPLQPNEAPTVALTAPNDNAQFTAPAAFTLSATASDADGMVAKVAFYLNGELLGEDNTAPHSLAVSGLAQGTYVLTARASDNLGETTESAPVTVEVAAPNTIPPTVVLTAPIHGATFLEPATIWLTAEAADVDGTIAKVEFFNGAVKLGEDSTEPYTFEWKGVAAGSYRLTARATDNLTASTTSTPVVIEVLVNQPPTIQLTAPADLAGELAASGQLTLSAAVSDPEGQPLTVTFFGRAKAAPPGPDFSVVAIPDTQFYSQNTGGTRLANFTSQTNWMVSQRTALNIAFVAHLGDMVQSGDTVEQQWINANTAMSILENPVTTTLPFGIPWGGAPGNHDQQPIGSSDGGSRFWNEYFGTARWAGRPTYGGNYGTDNDNNYHLFSASGLDFVVVNLEYRAAANQGVLAWADSVLKAFPNRRAIVTSHWLIATGNPANWGGHGQAVYDRLKSNPNLFLMLCGHIAGEGQRSDTFAGRTVHTLLQDYQNRPNGGDSWLRYLVFSPANNTISARTIQTTTGAMETDTNSQFSLPYVMSEGAVPWVEIGTVAATGGAASVTWTGIESGSEYEWYAAVSDGPNAVGSEERRFSTTTNVTDANFTLQLLHLSDGEAGLLASQTAPNLAALVDAFEDRYANTLIVSGGDNFIPSPFLNAGTDPLLNTVSAVGKTNFARPDIAILNLLGVEASAIGNHEWDLGSNVFMDAIRSDGAWSGALFPHLAVNLDYSLDSAALARFTDVPQDGVTTPVPLAAAGASRLVPMAVVNMGGEKIGVLGVTTQILRAISSPSGTFAKGYPVGTTGVDNMDLLATQLQPYVNELIAEGVNKIVLLSHLQQIANEQSLATKLTGVDIIVAAGSNTRLGDADDVAVAFPGHAANFTGTYPLVTAGADSKPVLIVSTDNEFTYLGRLVVEFNTAGELITSNLASRVAENGSYAATPENVAAVWGVPVNALADTAFAPGTKGALVKQVTDTVQTVINAKDGIVYGYTAVYLEGERAFVRGQEANLGNITADANQHALRAVVGGTAPIVSLKNGGGIRAQIGAVSSVGGSVTKLPPPANSVVGKSEGGISQLDIENALRFNNRLMAFETTPTGLKAILEHGVASWPNEGRFPQIGGVAFAWDPVRPADSRVTSISLMNDDGTLGTPIYKEGPLAAAILRAAPPVIQMVTLNFLANDGDGYPIKANGSNFRYVLDNGALGPVIADESLSFTVVPQLPPNALGEQAAFASFLQARHGNLANAFRQVDTPASADERIQIATFRADTVPPLLTADSDGDGISDVLENLIGLDAQSGIRIGETVAMDLSPLAGSGSVLRLVGKLPAGLRFDSATGRITGQLLGLPGSYPVQIQELLNGRMVATQWLNFEVAAFPAGLLGGFEALLEDGTGNPRGIIRLTISRAGQWTGSLDVAGALRRSSRGTFTLVNGAQAAVNAVFPAARGISATTVNLLLDAATPLVAGTYTSGAENGSGRGFRLVDRSSSVPMTQKLTLSLDAGEQDGVAYPAGMGWARGSAGVTGSVSLIGSLGDGQFMKLGLKLSRTGQAVVWSQPYRNKGSYVGGIVLLAGLGQPLPFPQRQEDGLRWFKAADGRELSYEAGFAAPLAVTAVSSRWDRPATAEQLASALGLTNATLQVEIEGAGLSNAAANVPVLATAFELSPRYVLVTSAPQTPAPVPWAGTVRAADGGFSGQFTLPVGASNVAGRSAVSGVLVIDEASQTTVGRGLLRVPIAGRRGAFRSAAVVLKQ